MIHNSIAMIDKQLNSIKIDPSYSITIKEQHLDFLRAESFHQSVLIERVGDGLTLKKRKKREESASRNVWEAWKYIEENGLNLATFSVLGGIIEPDANESIFRNLEVQLGRLVPPPPNRIHTAIDNLVYFLENTQVHPILRSIEAHIQVAGIQPYNDGNKRTARLIQSYCLEERSYPSPVIAFDERAEYMGLLMKTIENRYNKKSTFDQPSSVELMFREYIVDKIYEASESLEALLKKHRIHNVCPDKESDIHVLSDSIHNYARRHQKTINTKKSDPRQKCACRQLQVTGDISRDELILVLDKTGKNYSINY